ncbi:MAG TPA: trypsin-like peptidase domain-containing protein [Candidatus Omnitrophota bacterium]|nr:trypsin-like peptidase domain-containing protein [Candidatus Omnitrophota bacterium]
MNRVRKFVWAAVFVFLWAAVAVAELSESENALIGVFEKASPSVVFIKNAALQWDWFSDDIYEVPQGAGSGFVWDTQGHIITNFHVVYQADRIMVVMADRKSYPAKVIGVSPDHDLAVLKIEAPQEILRPLELGTSQDLRVGQSALSIGNPFGLDYSLTTGVVSALGRSISSLTGRKIHDVIQTDAAINPGSSGGPLLDSSGKLIGVSTAIFSPSGAYAGVGFAIPVDDVKRVVPQLIKYGRVKRLGIGADLVPDHIRRRIGVEGAMILNVAPGSNAQKAGVQPTVRDRLGNIVYGDIIVAVDRQPVVNNDELLYLIERNYKAGDKAEFAFLRNGRALKVFIELQEF